MATADEHASGTTAHAAGDEHANWEERFSAQERQELLDDDAHTWRNVVLELVALICMGVALMAVTVLWIVAHPGG